MLTECLSRSRPVLYLLTRMGIVLPRRPEGASDGVAKTGSFPRTAQAVMRHSDVNLTMGAYTGPHLLDVLGALDALPALPLGGVTESERIAVSATGTDDFTARQFAQGFAPTPGKPCKLLSVVKMTADEKATEKAGSVVVSACPDKRKRPLTTRVNGLQKERETGFEPATSSLGKHRCKPAFSAQNR